MSLNDNDSHWFRITEDDRTDDPGDIAEPTPAVLDAVRKVIAEFPDFSARRICGTIRLQGIACTIPEVRGALQRL